MRWLGVLARMLLGVVFLLAAWDKIADPMAFAKIIRNYQILPDNMIGAVALVLPWIEVVVSICLVAGCATRGAGLSASLMMFVFIGAMAWTRHKGISTQCGCFTTKAEDAISLETFIRDGSIFVLALLVTVHAFVRSRRT